MEELFEGVVCSILPAGSVKPMSRAPEVVDHLLLRCVCSRLRCRGRYVGGW